VPLRSGGGRRGCGCCLCRRCRLRRGRHVIGVIETHPGHASCGPFLALRHRRVKAFNAAAVASVYFHANGKTWVVPLSPDRRCSEDYSCRESQPNQSTHHVPPEPAYFVLSNTFSSIRTSYKTITIAGRATGQIIRRVEQAAFGRPRPQIMRATTGIFRNSTVSIQLPPSVPVNTIAALIAAGNAGS
jgi:hypothetical protein